MARVHAPRRRLGAEDGFTLIEVLVTMVVLVVGTFPVMLMLDRGNETTGSTLRREGATNLAREVVERAQALGATTASYTTLTPALVGATLRTSLDPSGTRHAAATGARSFTIDGRNPASGSYAVTLDSCIVAPRSTGVRVIDPADPICTSTGDTAVPAPAPGPIGASGACQVAAGSDPAIGVYIQLLVSANLCAGGALVGAVCDLLGDTSPLDAVLDPLIAGDGAVNLLLGSTLGGSASVDLCGGKPISTDPGSMTAIDGGRRIRATVTYGTNPARTLTQTTVVARGV